MSMYQFIGGPYHNETRAVDDGLDAIIISLPQEWRKDSRTPEWIGYVLDKDSNTYQFTGRAKSYNEILDRNLEVANDPVGNNLTDRRKSRPAGRKG